jgi:hypothetical protein
VHYCGRIAAHHVMPIFHDVDDATVLVAHLLLHQVSRANPGRHETTLSEGESLRITAI